VIFAVRAVELPGVLEALERFCGTVAFQGREAS
jgi:hypothetical protein